MTTRILSSDPITRTERLLLLLAGIFALLNIVALTILRGGVDQWLVFALWGVCAIGGTYALNRFLPGRDPVLFPLVMFLSSWGIVEIDRLAPRFADRQIIWLAISVSAMLSVALFPHVLRWLKNYRYLWLVFGLVLLVSTITLGRNPSGASGAPQLWLGLGSIFFQPSELLKVILVAFLASYLAEHYPLLRAEQRAGIGQRNLLLSLSPRIIGPILLMWGLSIVVLIWQRDLGTATLFFIVFLVLLYVATGNIFILTSGVILIGIAGFIAYNLFAVVQLRVDIWINPWAEAEGRAFQIVQSLQAFAAGGIFGQGIGQGSPFYIPVVHSDFIFAAIAEEWGLLGVITLIGLFAVLTMRGLRIAIRQSRPFYALFAVGITTLITTQAMLIMGGVIRVFPLTGVTLPFLSYGGSSLLISYIIIGLLLRLSSQER